MSTTATGSTGIKHLPETEEAPGRGAGGHLPTTAAQRVKNRSSAITEMRIRSP